MSDYEVVRKALRNYGSWRGQQPKRAAANAALDRLEAEHERQRDATQKWYDEAHNKRAEVARLREVLNTVGIYLQRSQFLVGADALREDVRVALEGSGAAGTANESSHSSLPTSDNAAPETP